MFCTALLSGGHVLKSQSLLDDIDRFHLRATKIIHGLPRETHSSEVRSNDLWNPIISFYIKRLLVIILNVYNGTTIDPLRDLIVKSETKYNFRKTTNIEVPRPRKESHCAKTSSLVPLKTLPVLVSLRS